MVEIETPTQNILLTEGKKKVNLNNSMFTMYFRLIQIK